MLTEIYIEAVDERLADQVWEAWDSGEIDDLIALRAWWVVAASGVQSAKAMNQIRARTYPRRKLKCLHEFGTPLSAKPTKKN